MSSTAPKLLTGFKVLLILVAFFGVVIGANVTVVKLAIATLPGTDVESPYAAGLAYEKEIEQARDQAARNWQVEANVRRDLDGSATIQIEALDANKRPVTGLKFEGSLERPTDKRRDLSLAFAEIGIGLYRARVASVASGQWDLVLEVDASGTRVFQSRNRMILK
ncbi:FixH family protein [Bradyrhizobium sp. LMG 9283]|uniref:FixH family protein n=1 Tax=Bradyrhizobium sp. LMG 9283 TaxID=592064 RepID=UPI003890269F